MEVLPITSENYNSSEEWHYEYPDAEESAPIEALSKRLEAELRAAKRSHLDVGEVLLPTGLTRRVAHDLFRMADIEPCGLRGCTLYIGFEGDQGESRKLSTVKCDPATPSTFEVYLTLKQSSNGWNFLPQFLRKITRSGTVMISSEYELQKKKLYRSSSY